MHLHVLNLQGLMPTRLFGEEPHHLGAEPESVSKRELFAESRKATAVGDTIGSEPASLHSGLAAAIEHAREGMVRQVTGQIMRVFRRKLLGSACELSAVSEGQRSMAELEHNERYNRVLHGRSGETKISVGEICYQLYSKLETEELYHMSDINSFNHTHTHTYTHSHTHTHTLYIKGVVLCHCTAV